MRSGPIAFALNFATSALASARTAAAAAAAAPAPAIVSSGRGSAASARMRLAGVDGRAFSAVEVGLVGFVELFGSLFFEVVAAFDKNGALIR